MFEFLGRHGAAVLFATLFVEQMGLPLPAAPWLLAAGALAGAHKANGFAALTAAAIGSIAADVIWFYLGRHFGSRILNLLCRISLEPDSCVRRTQNMFTRYGMRGIVVAKFIPGLSTLAPPLAGNSGASVLQFVVYDGAGSFLYVGTFMLLGVVFRHQLDQIITELASLGANALGLAAGIALIYIGYKYFQRQRLLAELRMARITVEELNQRLEAGEELFVLDLRSSEELEQNPSMIRGARHTTLEAIERQQMEMPQDREIVLYCSCPNEITSARMALQLRRRGITRVRPLLGGIDAWRERNYPTELRTAAAGNSEQQFAV